MRLFVTANTARAACSSMVMLTLDFVESGEAVMSFNYLTNSGGFTRIAAYVGQVFEGAIEGHLERLSQQLHPDPASKCLNRPCELSEFMSRTIAP
jgi:hypothetical protein